MTTETTADATHLDAYHFYEADWEDYDHLRDGFEWEIPGKVNMASYLCDRWADDDEDRIALYAENEAGEKRSYTFEELQSVANRLANFLRDRGVERGDRVGVNAPQKPETVFAHVAAWKLGAVSVPLSTLFGPDALGYRLDDSDAVACVVDESNLDALREVRDDCPALETVVTVDGASEGDEVAFWDAVDGPSAAFKTVDTDAEDDAIVIYTSGTTGDPKGVRHAHRVILGHLPLFLTTFCNMELGPDDTFWTPSEWAWVASLFDVVFPGLYYGKPVLAYAGGPFDAEKAFELVEKYGVTNFFAPATALRMMMQVDSSRYDVDDFRVIASGGESLGQSIAEWAEDVFAGAAVHEGYGQTEANLTIGDCTALTEFREGTMGRAAPGMEVAIVDPETAEPTVETGEVGEIAIRYEGNPVCFKEYWRKPERTRKKVRNGWLLTEDLGSMDSDGYVAFESRKDDVIISSGYRIGPVEVEESLVGHPAVADAAVIGVPDDERGEIPKAFVVCAADHEASPDLATEIQTHVKERLAAYEYPREIEFVEELPKTETGKVRRASLRDEDGVGSEETV